MDAGGGVLVLVVLVAVYFLPTIIAGSREHLSSGAIFALNLFAGWSGLGWLIALVWALNSNTRENFVALTTGRLPDPMAPAPAPGAPARARPTPEPHSADVRDSGMPSWFPLLALGVAAVLFLAFLFVWEGAPQPAYQPAAAPMKIIVPAPSAPQAAPESASLTTPAESPPLRVDVTAGAEPGDRANAHLLALPAQGRAAMLGKVVGDRCVGKTAFYMGEGKEGFGKDKAFWSVRCADRRAFTVEIDPDGSTSVLECRVFEALHAGRCFHKFR